MTEGIMRQEIDYKGYKIKIAYDEDCESPDDWGDDERFLVLTHKQFDVQRKGFRPIDIYNHLNNKVGDEDFEKYNNPEYDNYYIFQVEAHIHSGIVLRLFNGRKQCQWDSSVTGFVLIKKEDTTEEQAKEYAERLIETWNQYLSGEVYGYVVEEANVYYQISKQDLTEVINKPHGYINLEEFYVRAEEDHDWGYIDSCYGFYGDPEESGCIDEAKRIIDNLVKDEK